jgi:hypothetical protein
MPGRAAQRARGAMRLARHAARPGRRAVPVPKREVGQTSPILLFPQNKDCACVVFIRRSVRSQWKRSDDRRSWNGYAVVCTPSEKRGTRQRTASPRSARRERCISHHRATARRIRIRRRQRGLRTPRPVARRRIATAGSRAVADALGRRWLEPGGASPHYPGVAHVRREQRESIDARIHTGRRGNGRV